MNLIVRLVGRQSGTSVAEWKLEGDYTAAHFHQLYELVKDAIQRTIHGFEWGLRGGTLELTADDDQIDGGVKTTVEQAVQDAFRQVGP